MNRTALKQVGVNLLNRDSGSTLFGIGQGSPGTIKTVPGAPGTIDPATGLRPAART